MNANEKIALTMEELGKRFLRHEIANTKLDNVFKWKESDIGYLFACQRTVGNKEKKNVIVIGIVPFDLKDATFVAYTPEWKMLCVGQWENEFKKPADAERYFEEEWSAFNEAIAPINLFVDSVMDESVTVEEFEAELTLLSQSQNMEVN